MNTSTTHASSDPKHGTNAGSPAGGRVSCSSACPVLAAPVNCRSSSSSPSRPAPAPASSARGDALAAGLQASAAQTGVNYLIWSGRIWSVDRAAEGWRPYTGAGVYNTTPTTPAGITGGHYDHVDISVF